MEDTLEMNPGKQINPIIYKNNLSTIHSVTCDKTPKMVDMVSIIKLL